MLKTLFTGATGHGYVDSAWMSVLPLATDEEKMMMEGTLSVQAKSRLSCQIKFRPDLDDIVMRPPESQF